MCKTGEPGHSYNFYENEEDTLRNACCEFTSEDDSDVCNLGSINFANIQSIRDLRDVVNLASKFLICGTLRGDVPYDKVVDVREANRKIGLGLMGVHEWLLKKNSVYGMTNELRSWLEVYRDESERAANEHCDRFFLNRPKKYRAVAPAGTIGILAGTTTGIEPLYAVAYKRGCIEGGVTHTYEYVIDGTARTIIDNFGVNAESIETAGDLAKDPVRRIAFQADVQDYVDMAISSTLNLPEWGSEFNNEDTVVTIGDALAHYAQRLRGITVYPDGARGGQPLTEVPYSEAVGKEGVVYEANEESACSGGICGI
jgi:ribonucleoside-diphosphate reductase alpha chain